VKENDIPHRIVKAFLHYAKLCNAPLIKEDLF